ncbi:MAG: hypothetical protein AAB263_07900 [Planctomycetota bacterium]
MVIKLRREYLLQYVGPQASRPFAFPIQEHVNETKNKSRFHVTVEFDRPQNHVKRKQQQSSREYIKEQAKDLADELGRSLGEAIVGAILDGLFQAIGAGISAGVEALLEGKLRDTTYCVLISDGHEKVYFYPEIGFNRFRTSEEVKRILKANTIHIELMADGRSKLYQEFEYQISEQKGYLDLSFSREGRAYVDGHEVHAKVPVEQAKTPTQP